MSAQSLELFYFSRTPQGTAGFCASVLAIFEHLHPIYKNVFHAHRVLMRFLIRDAIGDRPRIEHYHIGKHPFLEKTDDRARDLWPAVRSGVE